MGILNKAVFISELKADNIFDRLLKLGITHSRDGRALAELNYQELKMELVFATLDYEGETF